MKKSKPSTGLLDSFWNLFKSVKLTVFILLALALTSVIGTIVPQNQPQHVYLHEFGDSGYRILSMFDIFDMYHSIWFQFLLLMLTINIIVCSIERLPNVWKIIFVKDPHFSVSNFRRMKNKQELTKPSGDQNLIPRLESLIAKNYRYHKFTQLPEGDFIFAEKGRWTRIGVYTVHLSVILLILGGLIGSIFGFEGYVNIPEGEMVNQIELRKIDSTLDLGFAIRCDKFEASFYDSGQPKDYTSKLAIIDDGKVIDTPELKVNQPYTYKGISLYQSNYGMLSPDEATLVFTSRESKIQYRKKCKIGQKIDLPEGFGQFEIKGFLNHFTFRGHDLDAAFIGTSYIKGKEPVDIGLPLKYPTFDKMRGGDYYVTVEDYKGQYYTGLQVNKDPGVIWVYSGFVLMLIGIYISFFLSHERICVEIISQKKNIKIIMTGHSNKNKIGMDNRIKSLSKQINRSL